jgi:hypothetical protein
VAGLLAPTRAVLRTAYLGLVEQKAPSFVLRAPHMQALCWLDAVQKLVEQLVMHSAGHSADDAICQVAERVNLAEVLASQIGSVSRMTSLRPFLCVSSYAFL